MIKKHITFDQTAGSSVHPLSESSIFSPFSLWTPPKKQSTPWSGAYRSEQGMFVYHSIYLAPFLFLW